MSQVKTRTVSSDGFMIITAPVVEKEFISPKGESNGIIELYLRLSMQDFFIKFCESKVSEEELKKYISEDPKDFRVGKFEIEIREGAWDHCDEVVSNSRIGSYVVIMTILK